MAAPPETLVLRALKLGDLLVAVPAIHAIRRARPDHRLVLAVPGWLGPIVDLISGVDALHPTPGLDAPLDIAPGRVHTAINMHGNGPESRAVIDALDAPHVVAHGGSGPAWLDGILERWRWSGSWAFGMPGDPDEVAITRPLAPAEVPGRLSSTSAPSTVRGSGRWRGSPASPRCSASRADGSFSPAARRSDRARGGPAGGSWTAAVRGTMGLPSSPRRSPVPPGHLR